MMAVYTSGPLKSLALVVLSILARLSMADAADDCVPNIGTSGPLMSVTLVVRTWEQRSSNFHFDDPDLTSTQTFQIPKDSRSSKIGSANVRFYGKELCVAVKKVKETERRDGSIDRSSSCQKSCFGVGGGARLQFYEGTFGTISSSNPPCCLSGSIKTYEFSIPAPPTTPPPSYTCVTCSAADDCSTKSSTDTCHSGEKCFTLKLQKKETSEVATVKGCSHQLRYWGKNLDCNYQCKNNVRLWPDEPGHHYSVCVSCCSGNKCNGQKVTSGARSSESKFFAMVITLFFTVHILII